jgi:long-chain acyl-CoA synthetase
MRVGDAVVEHARSHPYRPAVVAPGGTVLSYRELVRLAEAEAAGMCGSDPEVPVPVAATSALEYLVRFIGVMQAGRVALCLPDQMSPARVRELLSLFGTFPLRRELYDGLFYMGLTSGSTGEPKAVLRTHDSWLRSFALMSELFGAPERTAVLGSLSFSGTLIAALHALHEGGTLWLLPGRDVLPLMEQERISAAFMVPALLRALVELSHGSSSPLAMTITTAGAKLDPETRAGVARLLPASRLFEYYGAAETGFVTYMDPAAGRNRPTSVGRLCPEVACELRGEDGSPVPPGERGVLYVRSPYQFAGYAGQRPVPPDGWVTVGDWGYFDAGGYLYLLGRSEEKINVGGLKVFAVEIERALTSHPWVEEAAAIALPDRLRGQVAGVAVVTTPGAAISALALRRWCAWRLPRPAVPRRIAAVPALPRNASGKLDRGALARLLSERVGVR